MTYDLLLAGGVAHRPDIPDAAQLIATRLDTPALWAAQGFPPSAYWLITPDGTRTRARVYDEENGDLAAYRLDAVEKPVPQFPSVRVERLPEVIREHQVPTPVTDELATWLADEDTVLPDDSHETVRDARTYLTVWEQLTERIAAGWPPDGWYPTDFYRDDLTARDRLELRDQQIPHDRGQPRPVLHRRVHPDRHVRSVPVVRAPARGFSRERLRADVTSDHLSRL